MNPEQNLTGSSTSSASNTLQIPQKRSRMRRKKSTDVERLYFCKYPGCNKGYGLLSHLNDHVRIQNHGRKRTPDEFTEIRRLLKINQKDISRTHKRNSIAPIAELIHEEGPSRNTQIKSRLLVPTHENTVIPAYDGTLIPQNNFNVTTDNNIVLHHHHSHPNQVPPLPQQAQKLVPLLPPLQHIMPQQARQPVFFPAFPASDSTSPHQPNIMEAVPTVNDHIPIPPPQEYHNRTYPQPGYPPQYAQPTTLTSITPLPGYIPPISPHLQQHLLLQLPPHPVKQELSHPNTIYHAHQYPSSNSSRPPQPPPPSG